MRNYRLAPTKNASVGMEMTELGEEREENLNRIELVETVTCRADLGEEDQVNRWAISILYSMIHSFLKSLLSERKYLVLMIG